MEPTRDPAAPPDRDAPARLSSRRRFPARRLSRRAGLALGTAALVSVAAAAATLTIREVAGGAPAVDAGQEGAALAPAAPPRTDPLWPAIDQWDRLRRAHALPFAAYASFLTAHRGWPGELAMRRDAEKALTGSEDAATLATYFAACPPLTGAARAAYANALADLGRADEARAAATAAWAGGYLPADAEARLLARFGQGFTQADQDRRMERLLWDRATASAQRQLALVSPARQPLYAARLAYQARAADAAERGAALGAGAARDAGYLIDRATWLRDTARGADARLLLARPAALDAPPFDPQLWLAALLAFQRGAVADGQAETAYGIARGADAALPAAGAARDAGLALRDPYTSLVWAAGWAALHQLNRPRDAEAMFVRYASAAQSPGSRAKGDYWAGRAADAAGDPAGARTHYAAAAVQIDQFYGQLAAERLGRAIALPADPPPAAIPADARAAFDAREVVRAARLLGGQRRWLDQTQFVRLIGTTAATDADRALADDLAGELGRPDLAVLVSRQPRPAGPRDPLRLGFPTIPVPAAMAQHWTMVHALSRQETNFDRAAVSPVGARGLMQLMPATAREQAGKLGLPYQPDRLTEDAGYNVTLGSAFFDRMVDYYGGSLVLAVAAYNAGPGNVNKFLRANGDPRLPGTDVVDWIEAIPLSETRTYVQKVLENAVVYDLLNPQRARTPERDRLSHYLAKRSPG